jgi:hypothetical protein
MEDKKHKIDFPFGKENYKLLLISVGIIVLGFVLMIGGGTEDPNTFNNEIFSFRRITLAPIVVIAGFIAAVFAIMKKAKD